MEPRDPIAVEAAMAAYYDQEGDGRSSRPIDPRRLAARDAFLSALRRPCSVLEIGPGPGRDAEAFVHAGHRHVGLDLSFEHARRCAATGSAVVVGSVRQLPFETATFDAVWTMSTLMHVPDSAIDLALGELARVLRPGGVAAVGVWGGPDIEADGDEDRPPGTPRRLFSRRSNDRWRAMLAALGTVQSFDSWGDEAEFAYQLAVVRRGPDG